MATGILASAGASAQSYVGASVGQSKWAVDCSGATSCSDTDTAYKVFGGYNFSQNLAVEATYSSLGTINATVGTISADIKASSFDVAAMFKAPVSKDWVLFAKLGVGAVKGEVDASMGSVSGSTTKNATQAVAGVGAIYNVGQDFGIRADIDTRKVDLVGSSGNVTNVSIGAQVSF